MFSRLQGLLLTHKYICKNFRTPKNARKPLPHKAFQVFVPIITQANEVLRKNLPTFVMYRSGFLNICVGTSLGVLIFMLRNFQILNIFLFLPMRFCVKMTGPGSSTYSAIEIINHTGISTIIPIKLTITSMALLINFLYNILTSESLFNFA